MSFTYGRPMISHSPVSSVSRSPIRSCVGRTKVVRAGVGSRFFSAVGGFATKQSCNASTHCVTRRRKTVHGHQRPLARPLSWSASTVASPRNVWLIGSIPPNLMNRPVTVQSSDSPFTKPSKDAVPPVPCASPFTFAPFCWSTHRIERGAALVKLMEPSHVPVTSTSVKIRLVQSSPAHPRLERASRIRSRPVHLMPVSPIGRVPIMTSTRIRLVDPSIPGSRPTIAVPKHSRVHRVASARSFSASHAARYVACQGVRSQPVPVALVGECSMLVA